MTMRAATILGLAIALSGCVEKPKPIPSPHAYLHPPEAPHLLAELPRER